MNERATLHGNSSKVIKISLTFLFLEIYGQFYFALTTFDRYINKLIWFKDEFEKSVTEVSQDLTKYFKDIKNDIAKIRTAVDNKTPLELIKTSLVSAVARVLIANLLGAAVTGNNPLNNPYFWELTVGSMPAVAVLNYLDYYYSMFAKLTGAIVKGLNFGFNKGVN